MSNYVAKGGDLSRRKFLGTTAAATVGAVLGTAPGGSPARAQNKKFEGQTLNFALIQPHVASGHKLAADFEAASGAKVNIISIPYDQLFAKATLDVQSGANQYDVIDFWYTNVGALARDGTIIDLTDRIEQSKDEIQPDDFLPSIYDPYTLYNGKRWALPYDGDSHLLFVNTEIYDRHGLKPPATWDEYLANTRTITEAESKHGIYGAAVLGGKAPVIIGSSYANRLAGFGGQFFTSDGKSALDGEAAIAAAQALKDIAPYALPTPLETRFEEGIPAWLSGKVAAIEFWSDLGVYSQDPKGSKIIGKWQAVGNPIGGKNKQPRLALNGGYALAISSGTSKQDLAWEFVKYATSAKVNEALLLNTGSGIDPNRTSTLYSEAYKKFAPGVQNKLAGALEHAVAWPTAATAPKLQGVLADELALILSGEKEPAKAIADAHSAWRQILGA